MYDYWLSRRSQELAPLRREIEPSGLSSALGSIFLLAEAEKQTMRFRIAGTRLCTLFCRELRHGSFSEPFDRRDHAILAQALDAVTSEHAILVNMLTAHSANGNSVTLESVILPLRDEERCVIGAMNPMTTPVWLGSDPITRIEMASIRMMDPGRELFALHNRPAIPLDALHIPQHSPRRTRNDLAVIDGMGHRPTNAPPAELRLLQGGKD